MKLFLSFFLLIFLFINGFSQTSEAEDTTKTIETIKENNNNKYFNYDADDIYAGKNEVDSMLIIDKNEYSDTYEEEDIYEKRARTEHFLRVFVNVSLLVLWVFSHY